MIRVYKYELWNGSKVLGYYTRLSPLTGQMLVAPEMSTLKQSYSEKYRVIRVPIWSRIVFHDGIDITYRIYLDVRRKSKRQIDILKSSSF